MSKYTERPSMSMCANHGDYQRQLIAWQKSKIEGLENTNLEMLEMLKEISQKIDDSDAWWMSCPDKGGFDQEKIHALITKIEPE